MKNWNKNIQLMCIFMLAFTIIIVSSNNEESIGATFANITNNVTNTTTELSKYNSLPYYNAENFQRYLDYKTKNPENSWETVITYVNIGLDNAHYTNVNKITEPASLDVLVNKYNCLPKDYVPANLETINSKYSSGTQQLRSDARVAFELMCADAAKQHLAITSISAYRSYDKQNNLYYSKIIKNDAASMAARDKVSAKAGYSEHQLGLAVDVTTTNQSLENTAEYKWYSKNAYKYGFIVRYHKDKENVTGYSYEPWHLRYLGVDLATAVYKSGLSYDEYYTRIIEPTEEATVMVSKMLINNTTVLLDGYTINGSNYLKLRDLAITLNGTAKQFDIGWDSSNNATTITTPKAYTPTADELEKLNNTTTAASNSNTSSISTSYATLHDLLKALNNQWSLYWGTADKTIDLTNDKASATTSFIATPTTAKIYLNGSQIKMIIYNIDGTSYFKMRDLAVLLNFGLALDNNNNAITIDASSTYIAKN